MDANMKYPLNPLAACFIPLSMKDDTVNKRDVHSIEFEKCIPVYALEHGAPSGNKTKTDNSNLNLDLICNRTNFTDFRFTSRNPEVSESVYTKTPEKLIGDEASIDRSEDRTNVEKDYLEQKDMTGCLMELEQTSNMAIDNTDLLEPKRNSIMAENTDLFELERTLNMHEKADAIKMNWTSNIAHGNRGSETKIVGNAFSTRKLSKNLDHSESGKSGRYESTSSTESVHSTKSYHSDYETDVENIDPEVCNNLRTGILTNVESRETVERERGTTPDLVFSSLEKDLHPPVKNNTLSLYMTVLLSSILSSKTDETKTYSKKILKPGSKHGEECPCPSMFGWIIPFEYFGNPLNLSGTCKKNYVHTTYEHAIYDESCVPDIYKSLDFESHSIDSGHCSDDDEPSNSVDEINHMTLEQCSSELESIVKDVFDCVDKSLSLCEDEEFRKADKNSEIWISANKTEVQQSPIIDDGYHPLLQEITSENIDKEISMVETFLGDALAFGEKRVDQGYSSQSSCVPPCSVWCTNVPPPAIDTYKRFVKKIDSEPVNRNVPDEKVSRRSFYKRCFSVNDAPKGFDYDAALRLASSWEPKAQFYLKDSIAFKDLKGAANSKNESSDFISGQLTNPLKEGSDKWSLYDGADSMWQPLPDCVLSTDYSQKYPYRRARIMRRQKSVG